MKITELETILIDNIDPPIGHRKWLFIQLRTDEGLVGLGERVSGGATNLKPQIELLNDLFDRFVKGESPFDVEKIWQRMKTTLHDYSHPGAVRCTGVLGHRDGLLGPDRQGDGPAGLQPARRQVPRQSSAPTPT